MLLIAQWLTPSLTSFIYALSRPLASYVFTPLFNQTESLLAKWDGISRNPVVFLLICLTFYKFMIDINMKTGNINYSPCSVADYVKRVFCCRAITVVLPQANWVKPTTTTSPQKLHLWRSLLISAVLESVRSPTPKPFQSWVTFPVRVPIQTHMQALICSVASCMEQNTETLGNPSHNKCRDKKSLRGGIFVGSVGPAQTWLLVPHRAITAGFYFLIFLYTTFLGCSTNQYF